MINKTICFVSTFSLPHIGGVEVFTHQLAKRFVQIGFRVIHVSLNTEKITDREEMDGVVYFRLPCFLVIKKRFPIPLISPKFFQLSKEIKAYDFSFIFLNVRFYLLTIMAAYYAKKNEIPSILVEHGTNHFDLRNPILNCLSKHYEHLISNYLKNLVNDFFGVSEACNQWLSHFDITSSGVIHNGIDVNYEPSNKTRYRKLFNISDNAIIISYVGRLVYEKGIMQLIHAFFSVLEAHENTFLFIAGTGSLETKIRQVYNEHIIFLRKIDHDSVLSLFNETDIMVLPSDFPEGLPTTVLEAGYMGSAVIATPMGGTQEVIIDESYGIIIEDNQKSTIEAAISYLIEHHEIRLMMAENLKKRIINNFNWDRIFKNCLEQISHLLTE